MWYLWGKLEHNISFQQKEDQLSYYSSYQTTYIKYGLHQITHQSLNSTPVDILIVKKSSTQRPIKGYNASAWEKPIDNTNKHSQPKFVVEVWKSELHLWEYGPASKASIE